MKQTLSLTPSSAPLNLDPWFSGDPLVITGTVPIEPAMSSWLMQLWKYPHDINTEGAAPISAAVGTVVGSTMTITFTPTQTSYSRLGLSDVVGCNNYWLTLGGISTEGYRRLIRAGSIEFIAAPFDENAYVVTPITFTVADDMISFEYGGTTYTRAVVEVANPSGATDGDIIVVDDMFVVTIDGTSYTFPCVLTDDPEGATAGSGIVEDDMLKFTTEDGTFEARVSPV